MKLLNMENMRKKILKQNKKFNYNIAYLKIIKLLLQQKRRKKVIFSYFNHNHILYIKYEINLVHKN